MNRKLLLLLTAIISIFILSCSSAPKKSDEVNTRKNRASDYAEFGNQYFRQGLYNQSLIFFNMALEENIAVDYEPGISKTSSSLGRAYLIKGDIANAEKYMKDGYNLAKQLGDKDLIALSANNLAELNISKNLIPESEKFISEAISNAKPNSLIQAESYHTLAIIERKKGEQEKALATIKKAIEINKQNKTHSSLAANYYFSASIYSQDNNYSKAAEMLNLAIKEDRLEENSYGLAKDYKALGMVALKNSKQEEAYLFFIKSFNIFKAIKNTDEEKSVLKYLIEISSNLGKVSDAEYYKAQLGAIKE